MADFSDYQITTFVNNWFSPDTKTAADCLDQIKKSSQINELARVPLLLTLLCLAYNETLGFPRNKADLYKEAIDALLKRWDSTRRIKREEIYRSLSIPQKENMLSRIAAATFVESKYFIEEKDLREHISKFIINLPEINEANLHQDSEAVLKAIEAHHGIFVERARSIYSFSHLTFQEYFTAKYIVDNASTGTIQRLIKDYSQDSSWNEVIKITAGMLNDADVLFTMLVKSMRDAINF
jgi:predicted NACHT family NTPase